MPVLYEKREKRGQSCLAVTGFAGRVHSLQISSEAVWTEADGKNVVLPVRAVGRHAFDENGDIREVILPSSVTEIGPFAFYRCRNLERITMTDSVIDYYDGGIRENRKLQEICIRFEQGYFRVLKDILGDNTEVLHFRLQLPEGEARLTFPSYHNEDREDTYARAIHPKIVGAGYAYRENVSRSGIDFEGYDRSFTRAETEQQEVTARIALDRIGCPFRLEDAARKQYIQYLQEHAVEILAAYIAAEDKESLEVLLKQTDIDSGDMDQAVRLASAGGHTEICAMLMAYGRDIKDAAEPETFSMEDL
ncbi:MAG: leucine-rich repeat protein [Eubacteriales bacterium]|nr:leucine-rich repeat protein [Eubacteriales bacterium]